MIRYVLDNDTQKIKLDDGTVVKLSHKGVFVDILEPEKLQKEGNCSHILVKLFLPDGRILKGKMPGSKITLSSIDELYDGRFNSTQ